MRGPGKQIMLLIYGNSYYFLSEMHSKHYRHQLQHSFLHYEILPAGPDLGRSEPSDRGCTLLEDPIYAK